MTSNIQNKYILIISLLFSASISAQIDTLDIPFSNILLDEVLLETDYENSKIDFIRLKYRVLKVYPYLDTIRNILQIVDTDLSSFKKRRFEKRYIRKKQKVIVNTFRKEMMSLSRKEGVILSKLIYREFNMSVYDIISVYRGEFHALLWQSLSRIYEGDLKSEFNPEKNREDLFIDFIIENNIE